MLLFVSHAGGVWGSASVWQQPAARTQKLTEQFVVTEKSPKEKRNCSYEVKRRQRKCCRSASESRSRVCVCVCSGIGAGLNILSLTGTEQNTFVFKWISCCQQRQHFPSPHVWKEHYLCWILHQPSYTCCATPLQNEAPSFPLWRHPAPLSSPSSSTHTPSFGV